MEIYQSDALQALKHWSLEQYYGQHQNIADVVLQTYWQVYQSVLLICQTSLDMRHPPCRSRYIFSLVSSNLVAVLVFILLQKDFHVPIQLTQRGTNLYNYFVNYLQLPDRSKSVSIDLWFNSLQITLNCPCTHK